MDKLLMVLIYLSAFWNTVVLNCVKPVNWNNCSTDVHIWLIPELQRGWEMLLDPKIYEQER